VKTAIKDGVSGSIAIKRKKTKKYEVYFERVPLSAVAKETRKMPDKFINDEGNNITSAFIEYARPLVGTLPVIGRLKGMKVAKK